MRYLMCFLPPIAVLTTGRLGTFLLNCFLTMLFYVPGVVHAFMVVADHKADRRIDQLAAAMGRAKGT